MSSTAAREHLQQRKETLLLMKPVQKTCIHLQSNQYRTTRQPLPPSSAVVIAVAAVVLVLLALLLQLHTHTVSASD